MRLLVCGSRTWDDLVAIRSELIARQPSLVIEGEARGADLLARQAAEELGIPVLPFPADWQQYGRAAGPIRNRQMLDEGQPDEVLAFSPDLAKSKGTRNMVEQARKRGLPVTVIP